MPKTDFKIEKPNCQQIFKQGKPVVFLEFPSSTANSTKSTNVTLTLTIYQILPFYLSMQKLKVSQSVNYN